jgi:NitT/TauT family transport system ATP-binding protein
MVTPTTRLARGVPVGIRGLSHGFRLKGEPLPVLDDVTFEVGAGEFVALLGPSGCGKSTLLRLVAGLDRPLAGEVLSDGVPVTGPDPSRVVVFQDPSLFPWRTVASNVALGLEARKVPGDRRARVRSALDLVGLAEFAGAHPHHLSGGMAQRTSLARALVNDPQVLILDEPLGQLDSLTRLTMQGELVRLWQQAGFTALLVTHDVEEALVLATRVLVLSERPARVIADLPVDLPYPRHRDAAALQALRADVLGRLGFGR